MGRQKWGPDERQAAISLSFHGLAGSAPDTPVTPALPTLLRALSDRDLRATWFVEPELAEAEPTALTMITLAGHELGCLAREEHLKNAREALERFQRPIRGVRPPHDAVEPSLARVEAAGLGYSSPPETAAPTATRIPYDQSLSSREHSDVRKNGTQALHAALQLGIGRALERGTHLCLDLKPSLLERRDGIDVAVETLDLIAGLGRSERVWIAPLQDLSDWLRR